MLKRYLTNKCSNLSHLSQHYFWKYFLILVIWDCGIVFQFNGTFVKNEFSSTLARFPTQFSDMLANWSILLNSYLFEFECMAMAGEVWYVVCGTYIHHVIWTVVTLFELRCESKCYIKSSKYSSWSLTYLYTIAIGTIWRALEVIGTSTWKIWMHCFKMAFN